LSEEPQAEVISEESKESQGGHYNGDYLPVHKISHLLPDRHFIFFNLFILRFFPEHNLNLNNFKKK